MTRWRRGLVIGKFRPPHKGHGLLIETALARVDQLTVMVCADVSDSIPADLRAAWPRDLYPTAGVRVVNATGHDPDDSAMQARLTRGWLGAAPDVVFTSEAYGPRYARHLGCAHVAIDPERARVPVSGSRVLAEPPPHLAELEPPVRAYFVPWVVLVCDTDAFCTWLWHER